MRRFVLVVAFIGAAVFAGAFLLSFARPMLVERMLRELLRIELQHRVEETLGSLSDTRITRLAEAALRATDAEIARTRAGAHTRMSRLIESASASVSASLLREFRIFTGSNAFAFGLLAIVALARRKARLQLLVPALVIVGAVATTAGLYLFNQDWLHTIVFADFLGWGYAAWLASVALLLADIGLNHARVTTQLVNSIGSAVGSAASAIPC